LRGGLGIGGKIAGLGAETIGAGVGKFATRVIPGIGAAVDYAFMANDLANKRWRSAALNFAAGSFNAAGALTGLGAPAGSAIGLGINALNTGLDIKDAINDGFISKGGKVTKINDNDSVIALQPGGPLDRMGIIPSSNQGIFKGVSPSYGGSNNYSSNSSNNIGIGKIDVSGIITLNVPGGKSSSIDASELIHNQQFIKQLARKLSAQINRDANGGKQSAILGPDSF